MNVALIYYRHSVRHMWRDQETRHYIAQDKRLLEFLKHKRDNASNNKY